MAETTPHRPLPGSGPVEQNLADAFEAAWRTLAPSGMSREHYHAACEAYRTSYIVHQRGVDHGARAIAADEAARLPDNPADYEAFEYVYHGLDAVRAILARSDPLAFVTWHHGAQHHTDYAVARIVPTTAIFTLRTFQHGRFFTYPMLGSRTLTLVKMDRFLRGGRPILYYVDGVPLGETAVLPVLGLSCRLCTGPVRVLQAIPGLHLVPVSKYLRPNKVIEVFFHPPVRPPGALGAMSATEVLAALVSRLECDQREHAPEQTMWWFASYREQLAREISARRVRARRVAP
jgi:hypothetical protein